MGSLRETRKTLDNNDLNQVVASSGFSENKGLTGVLSLRAQKPSVGHSYLRIFLGTLRSVIIGLFFPLVPRNNPRRLRQFPSWRMANGVKLQFQNFLRNWK